MSTCHSKNGPLSDFFNKISKRKEKKKSRLTDSFTGPFTRNISTIISLLQTPTPPLSSTVQTNEPPAPSSSSLSPSSGTTSKIETIGNLCVVFTKRSVLESTSMSSKVASSQPHQTRNWASKRGRELVSI